jgi:tRNA modification GTPase
LSKRVNEIKKRLLETCSLLEIDLDFSEEDISVIPATEVKLRLESGMEDLRALIASYTTGKIVRDGVRVAIVGPPNAGKSSLFNALLEQDRAIVSEVPGTTRDYIEEAITIDGILFQLVDTAGIRETDDMVERQGVTRSQELLRSGDIGLAVIDCLSPPDDKYFQEWLPSSDRLVLAINKIDLLKDGKVPVWVDQMPISLRVPVSALTGDGIATLRSALISQMHLSVEPGETGLAVTNRRHIDALSRALECIERALASLDKGLTNEFIALDTRSAVSAIAEITGEITTDDILDQIFSRFCIGK